MTKKAISIVLVISLLMVMLTACAPWQKAKDEIAGVVENNTAATEDVTNPTEDTTPDEGENGATTTEPTTPDEITLVFISDSLTIEEGKDGRFEINHQGGGKLVWASSNEDVATVSSNGVIHAVSVGTATITATVDGTDVSDSGTVKVVEAKGTEPTAPSVDKPDDPTEPTKPVDVKVSINKTSLSLEVGQTSTLSASYNGTKSLTWSSSNTAVATVSNGKVTAKAAGTATIKVTDGSVTATCNVTVTAKPVETEPTQPPVEVSVKLNKTSATLNIGDTLSLTATTTGSGSLSWSSDNTSVATVSNGKVTAKGAGTATITATYGGKTATCKITVNKPVEVKLSLNKTSITLNVGETSTITANYSGASGKPAWSSSNTSVATVDSNGKVTAKGAGTAVITASYGGKNAQCAVTVNKPVEVKISLNKTSITLEVGETSTLTASYNGTKSLAWSSDNTAVATVSNGKVTAKGAGTATIKVTDGNVTATCKVTVNKPAATEPTNPPSEVKLSINPDFIELNVGETASIKATYSGASGKPTWETSDASVATVNSDGKVTAKGEGVAVITATYGGKNAQCVIQVYASTETPDVPEIGPAVSVSKSGNNGSWDIGCVGNSLSFNAVAKTADGDNRGVTATSSNTGVATVSTSANGSRTSVKVSFKGSGSVTITLTSDDGKASTSFTINVRGYSAQDTSTPEAYAAAINYVVGMNGCSVSSGGNYTVLTVSPDKLSWGSARAQGEGIAQRSWTNGTCRAGCAYMGTDENGNYIFHLFTT